MSEWVYTLRNGGESINQRALGKYESTYDSQTIRIDPVGYMAISDLIILAKRSIKHQNLRNEYPTLEELWQQYNALANLLANGEIK